MSDYAYDQSGHDVTLDPHDRAKNAPTALTGYPLDVQPQTDWPGTSASGGQFQIDGAAALKVADWLDEQARLLTDVPGRLASTTEGVRYGPSTWHEANHLKTASDQVSGAVADYGQQVVANLAAASEAIRNVVVTYASADTTNHASATSLNSNLPSDITAGSGRHTADQPPVI